MLKVFGIRHHGPGSSKRLLAALEDFTPDIVLIEGPTDANDLIPMVSEQGMSPPVALLIYNPKNAQQAAYYPFASFSPEWQAIKYALKQSIPVSFIDLPQSYQWSNKPKVEETKEDNEGSLVVNEGSNPEESMPSPDELLAKRDPLAYIAKLSGYRDGEHWWDDIIEQQIDNAVLFDNIIELMQHLREEFSQNIDEQTIKREAFMRKSIRNAQKQGYEKIAVVCGAWHAPVLQEMPKVKEDNATLKGMRKIKVAATWIPWTYERLANASGYGAGIDSPAWYELLFKNRTGQIVAEWMARTAHLFREAGQDGSPAHVIEATRLANTLALLRGRPSPVLGDFMESVQTIFCFGNPTPLQLIQKKLVVGEKMGSIPESAPILPLKKDILDAQKKFRLKVLSVHQEIDLDLRKPAQLAKSHFLHRLNLLGIEWGKLRKNNYNKKGTFHEYWQLKWEPEFEMQVIEAAVWGNTVEEACIKAIQYRVKQPISLPQLTKLLSQVFPADIGALITILTNELTDKAAVNADVHHFMEALPELVKVLRYGDVRKTETDQVIQVINAMLPRLFIGLPTACMNLNEEVATQTFKRLLEVNNAVQLIDEAAYLEGWKETLKQVAEGQMIHPKIKAGAARILFEGGSWDTEKMEQNMSLSLSTANKSTDAAAWIEGFLHGSGLLLIHNESLFHILDKWLGSMNATAFDELLPLLRRSFTHYSSSERKQLGKLAKQDGKSTSNAAQKWDLDEQRLGLVLPILKELLQ